MVFYTHFLLIQKQLGPFVKKLAIESLKSLASLRAGDEKKWHWFMESSGGAPVMDE